MFGWRHYDATPVMLEAISLCWNKYVPHMSSTNNFRGCAKIKPLLQVGPTLPGGGGGSVACGWVGSRLGLTTGGGYLGHPPTQDFRPTHQPRLDLPSPGGGGGGGFQPNHPPKIASDAPTHPSTPLKGGMTIKIGPGWVTACSLLPADPWTVSRNRQPLKVWLATASLRAKRGGKNYFLGQLCDDQGRKIH